MNINYQSSNLLTDYLQEYLKSEYSETFKINDEYNLDTRNALLSYLNTSDSVTRQVMSKKMISEYDNGDILNYFKKIEKVDEILFIAKNESSAQDIPNYNNALMFERTPVKWLYNQMNYSGKKNGTLVIFNKLEEFVELYGWTISSYYYSNENSLCEFTIKKRNKRNPIPKKDMIDMINMFERKYSETCFLVKVSDLDINADNPSSFISPMPQLITNLYNYEILEYTNQRKKQDMNEEEIKQKKNFLQIVPNRPILSRTDTSSIEALERSIKHSLSKEYVIYSGNYKFTNSESDQETSNFKGFTTFTSKVNILPAETEKTPMLYAIYVKLPHNNELRFNEIYVHYANSLGKEMTIDSITYTENIENVAYLNKFTYSSTEDYMILLVDIPNNMKKKIMADENYKLCVSLYDPNNTRSSVLCFRINNDDLTENLSEAIMSDPAKAGISLRNHMKSYWKAVGNEEAIDDVEKDISYGSCKITYKELCNISNVYYTTPEDYFSNPFNLNDKLLG